MRRVLMIIFLILVLLSTIIFADKVKTDNETHSWKSEITEQVQVAPKSAATCEVTFKGSTAENQSF
ncbi:hypothetical protein TBGT1766_02494 [Thermotoga sp. TBGT1766]|nr:hypothetical protein TBGT1766_02494 [Thermotoga sp. TBGT1766]